MKITIKQVTIYACVLSVFTAAYVILNQKASTLDIRKTLPMIVFENQDRLWQVITYDDEAVTAMTIKVYPSFEQHYKNVYLNFRSQFVFGDGSAVLLHDEPLFWNRKGDVVNYNYQTVSESMVFYIDGKGMKQNTAMTLKNLKTDLRTSVIKEKDKIREAKLEQLAEDRLQ